MNVLTALSKVIEKVYLSQITKHLADNELIGQAHHGAVPMKSTQTLVSELHDILVENYTKRQEAVLIILDQSKVYNIVSHDILLEKLSKIGFQPQEISIMKNYMKNRRQLVQLEGTRSDILAGDHSVIQGSTLSCVLFLIFILDMPELFHLVRHSPKEYRDCKNTNLKTFVDDAFLVATKKEDQSYQEVINENMDKITEYMISNKMAINPDKTTLMLITRDEKLKRDFEITIGGKVIKHKRNVTLLGNVMSDSLTWDSHVEKTLIPALNNRVRTLQMIAKYLNPKFRKIYVSAVFRSKLLFGVETWGGQEIIDRQGPEITRQSNETSTKWRREK